QWSLNGPHGAGLGRLDSVRFGLVAVRAGCVERARGSLRRYALHVVDLRAGGQHECDMESTKAFLASAQPRRRQRESSPPESAQSNGGRRSSARLPEGGAASGIAACACCFWLTTIPAKRIQPSASSTRPRLKRCRGLA